jgi:peptidoglycan/xylan/chitin deacetylase (PgdA/CDA1 family)
MRSTVKSAFAGLGRLDGRSPHGATLLIYHRVGGGTSDELDLPVAAFVAQLDSLLQDGHEVLPLDAALDRLDDGDDRPSVVLTFDDGFADLHRNALPHLVERGMPFTLYLTAGLVGGQMAWEGSAAASQGAPALTWDEVGALSASGLCTLANHTYTHAGPETVDEEQLDRCTELIEARLGRRPAHFAWTWGIPAPGLLPAVRHRFRSAATGRLGRNLPSGDRFALARVPVRASDPLSFFRAKLAGGLAAERAYAAAVSTAKRIRAIARHG